MWHVSGMQCCGVKEISALRTAFSHNVAGTFDKFEAGLLNYLVPSYGNPSNAYFFFTAVERSDTPKYGEAFKAFILKEGLGEVTESGLNKNPNSGNLLRVYLWTMDLAAVRMWYANQSKAAIKAAELALGVAVSNRGTAPSAPVASR